MDLEAGHRDLTAQLLQALLALGQPLQDLLLAFGEAQFFRLLTPAFRQCENGTRWSRTAANLREGLNAADPLEQELAAPRLDRDGFLGGQVALVEAVLAFLPGQQVDVDRLELGQDGGGQRLGREDAGLDQQRADAFARSQLAQGHLQLTQGDLALPQQGLAQPVVGVAR